MARELNFISPDPPVRPKNHSTTTFWYFTIKINLISFRRGFVRFGIYVETVIENLCWSRTTSIPNSLPAWRSPMFLQLDTVVECYLITNFFLSYNFTPLPYHVVWNATFMNFWWRLFPSVSPASHSPSGILCGADDVTNEKFIVAGKSFQTIRHILNGGMEWSGLDESSSLGAAFWCSSLRASCLANDGKRSSRCDRREEQNCFVLVSVRED